MKKILKTIIFPTLNIYINFWVAKWEKVTPEHVESENYVCFLFAEELTTTLKMCEGFNEFYYTYFGEKFATC